MAYSGSNYYQVYIKSVLDLANTLIIKSTDTAESLNEYVNQESMLGICNVVDSTNPETFKYYLNLSGQYHQLDTTMKVKSLDTLEIIDFTVENLAIHIATASAYQYGSRLYSSLVLTYPDQEVLIKGILYPVNINTAINAPDGAILGYPKYLVEENEYTLISKLQKWIYGFKSRWTNQQFGISDSLYIATNLGIMYLNLVPAILTIRLEACKTNEAHSFHVRQYLASHNLLNKYIDVLSLNQLLFFYRNIAYIERNAGKKYIFNWLIYNLMTVRNLPITEYIMKHDLSKMPTELYPKLVFYKNPINSGYNNSLESNLNLDQVIVNERSLALSNEEYEADYLLEIQNKMENSMSNELYTKILESSVIDDSNSEPYSLSSILFNHWIWLCSNNNYKAYISIINPKNQEVLSITVNSAFTLAWYCFCNSNGINPSHVPTIFATRVQRIVPNSNSSIVSVDEIMSVVDTSVIDRSIAVQALSIQPEIGNILSTNAFYKLCTKIHTAAQMQRRLIGNQETALKEVMTFNMVNRIYSDNICKLAADGELYEDWLSINNIDISGLTPEELKLLYLNIVNKATGADAFSTITATEVQAAMVGLMTQLSSYTIQFVTSINSSADTKTDWNGAYISSDKNSSANFNYLPYLGIVPTLALSSIKDTITIPNTDLLSNVELTQSINLKVDTGVMMSYTPPIEVKDIIVDLNGVKLLNVIILENSQYNPGVSLFVGGIDSNDNLTVNITDKYDYLTNTVITGTELTTHKTSVAGTGNSIFGLFAGGIDSTASNVTDKYTYSTDTVINGTALNIPRFYLAGIGNSNVGIFGGGISFSGISDITDKYDYSNDSVVSGTKLTLATNQSATIGNSNYGIFGGGNIDTPGKNSITTNITSFYTYSDDTCIGGYSLGVSRATLAGASSETIGIFGGGYGDINNGINYTNLDYTDLYSFSNNTNIPGCSLGINVYGLAASGNKLTAIFAGGIVNDEVSMLSRKYIYTSNVSISGSNLSIARCGLASACNTAPNSI